MVGGIVRMGWSELEVNWLTGCYSIRTNHPNVLTKTLGQVLRGLGSLSLGNLRLLFIIKEHSKTILSGLNRR